MGLSAVPQLWNCSAGSWYHARAVQHLIKDMLELNPDITDEQLQSTILYSSFRPYSPGV